MARATTKTTTAATRKTAPKTSAKSTKATPKTAIRTAAGATAPAPKGVTVPVAPTGELARELKKKELIEFVTAASGLKRSQARAAIEATLAALGEALAKGESLNLEPLGKVRVVKERDVGAAQVYTCRVRRRKAGAAKAGPDGPNTLAEAAE